MLIFHTDTRKMKGILFFLVLLLGIGIVIWMKSNEEGFQDAAPKPSIPLISPRYQTLTHGEVHAFAPPSDTLLAPPPGQSASVNARPDSDPAMEKSSSRRIQSVYESMIGFFKTDAPGLQKLGDPSIQLPLSTARSDMGRLKDELAVLSRNPGLESNLTGEDLDGIEANMGYLQRKWRMSINANSGSPMPPEEGFQSGSGMGSGSGSRMGSGSGSGMGSDTATLKDIKELSLKIGIEIIRLKASGASDSFVDMNLSSRIKVLETLKKAIDDIISDVESGTRSEKDIPITKLAITRFLPAMSNPNTALPTLIADTGLNNHLNSLFPKYSVGDISGSSIAKGLLDIYGNDFFKNLSWNVTFGYKSKAEQDIAEWNATAAADKLAAITSNGGVSASDDNMTANAAPVSEYRGLLASVVGSHMGVEPEVTVSSRGVTSSSAKSKSATPNPTPSTFDWKERSKQICAQIKAREMDPNEFGCLADPDKMRQESFSWRGHTRMVCDRLNTVYDTSIPFLCGCPPQTWPGWRQ